ncbi:MAG: hypothetical protein ACYTGB_05930, partial [Planctomycetota bacterium]
MSTESDCSTRVGRLLGRALRVSLWAAALSAFACGAFGGALGAGVADGVGGETLVAEARVPSGGGLFAGIETEVEGDAEAGSRESVETDASTPPAEPPPAAPAHGSYVRVSDTVQFRLGFGAEIYEDSDLGVGPVFEMEMRARMAGPL